MATNDPAMPEPGITRRHERPALGAALEAAGFVVFDASGRGRDRQRLRTFWSALILLDLPMSRMSGLEVFRRLRGAGDRDPGAFIVTHGPVPGAIAALRLGAVNVLVKPMTTEAVRGAVEGIIRGRLDSGPVEDRPRLLVAVDPLVVALLRAHRALDRRQFDEAERLLRAATEKDPGSAVAHNLMGVLHQRLGEHHAAYRSFRAGAAGRSILCRRARQPEASLRPLRPRHPRRGQSDPYPGPSDGDAGAELIGRKVRRRRTARAVAARTEAIRPGTPLPKTGGQPKGGLQCQDARSFASGRRGPRMNRRGGPPGGSRTCRRRRRPAPSSGRRARPLPRDGVRRRRSPTSSCRRDSTGPTEPPTPTPAVRRPGPTTEGHTDARRCFRRRRSRTGLAGHRCNPGVCRLRRPRTAG